MLKQKIDTVVCTDFVIVNLILMLTKQRAHFADT